MSRFIFYRNTAEVKLVEDILDLPAKKLRDKGVPLDNVSNYSSREEEILWIGSQSEIAEGEMFFATAGGSVKRCAGSEFVTQVRTIQSTKLPEKDTLVLAAPSGEMETAVLGTHNGYYIRFALSDVSVLRKSAVGVRGIHLDGNDYVTGGWLLGSGHEFQISVKGGKLSLNRLKLSKRGGKGTKSRRQ